MSAFLKNKKGGTGVVGTSGQSKHKHTCGGEQGEMTNLGKWFRHVGIELEGAGRFFEKSHHDPSSPFKLVAIGAVAIFSVTIKGRSPSQALAMRGLHT